jgi:hypothetical protein
MLFTFSKQDEAVANVESAEATELKARNERYEKFCENRREGESGGRYIERGVMTLNEPAGVAKCDIQPPAKKNQGNIQVTAWKLYDEMLKANEEDVEVEEGVKAEGDAADEEAQQADEDGGDGDEGAAAGDGGEAKHKKSKAAKWMNSASLLEAVMIVERCVVMNNYEDLQLAYRGLPMEPLTDHAPYQKTKQGDSTESPTKNTRGRRDNFGGDETQKAEEKQKRLDDAQHQQQAAGPPKMRVLWKYGAEVTKGKNVACMSWNQKNPDILAAGYGEYGIPGADGSPTGYGGFVCCWSVKNPTAPERVIKIESDAGVSAVHFSKTHPSLLAVGNTDGTLALYDVRVHGNAPALKTTVSTGQHTGTIWETRWVDKGKDRGETLVTISADGHVLEWSIKKGLERTSELMKLKRAPNRNSEGVGAVGKGAGTREALLSRQSGGMCFDINPRDQITYVVGTEDGTLHKCSKSQNENYVLDYKPHSEPVYRVRWSPFCPDYFLSASADWTSRLYDIETPLPLATFDSNRQDAVQDLCWSNTNASIFATATAQGNVDLWDVADQNQPRTTLELGRPLNCLVFAEQESPLLTVGDNEGDICVVKLTGDEFERHGHTDQEQEDRLKDIVQKVSVA